MTDRPTLNLIGFGLSSAFGPTWAAAQEGLASNTRVHRRCPAFHDAAFQPVRIASANGDLNRYEDRVVQMASEALRDSLDTMPVDPPGTVTISLVLGEPDPLTGLDEHRIQQATAAIQAELTDVLSRANVMVEEWFVGPMGHAGPGHAAQAMSGIEAPAHLLIGADCLADRSRIGPASKAGLLFSDKTPWGFVPGEAAGVQWLLREEAPVRPRLVGAASNVEAITERDEGETDYAPLSKAVKAAFADASDLRAARWYSDMNNHRYRAAETSYAMHRATPFWLEDDCELIQPAGPFGDCGPALPFCALSMALLEEGVSVISGSSTGGLRSVMVVEV